MMRKILLIRFSALGDVLMTVPVVFTLARQYPELQITLLSKSGLSAYFSDAPSNVQFKGVQLKTDYQGISGLEKLYQELSAEHYDYVADLHDVLRTKYLRARFAIQRNVRVAHILKGRKEKKRITKEHPKEKTQLPGTIDRYADVLKRLGFPIQLNFQSIWQDKPQLPKGWAKNQEMWVGIAPFAAHAGKVYPQEKMTEAIALLCQHNPLRLFLFGAGEREQQQLEEWEKSYPQVVSTAGKFNRYDELKLIAHLDCMISMDSANMHLASLVGIPVISIWGATHPCLGFMGWGQSLDNAVQIDLPCRPCSVYGNKPCARKDYACLTGIAPQMIADKVLNLLKK